MSVLIIHLNALLTLFPHSFLMKNVLRHGREKKDIVSALEIFHYRTLGDGVLTIYCFKVAYVE